jgi:hypothetical protein
LSCVVSGQGSSRTFVVDAAICLGPPPYSHRVPAPASPAARVNCRRRGARVVASRLRGTKVRGVSCNHNVQVSREHHKGHREVTSSWTEYLASTTKVIGRLPHRGPPSVATPPLPCPTTSVSCTSLSVMASSYHPRAFSSWHGCIYKARGHCPFGFVSSFVAWLRLQGQRGAVMTG